MTIKRRLDLSIEARMEIEIRERDWQDILKNWREIQSSTKGNINGPITRLAPAWQRRFPKDPTYDENHPSPYDEDLPRYLPLTGPDDLTFEWQQAKWIAGQEPEYFADFESACRDGPLSVVQSVISASPRSPAFLHHGLMLALRAGNFETARCLLYSGAAVVRYTPQYILKAPPEKQLPLFTLLARHGWTPNTRVYEGRTLLERVVDNIPVLRWFLVHGANPNLGYNPRICCGPLPPATESCAALEAAVLKRNVEAMRILLDAGAEARYGMPLHFAAGMRPPDLESGARSEWPSKEFDESMIPIMELLVERGADVNKRAATRPREFKLALTLAVWEGMVERVRWLLEHGANPELEDICGGPVKLALKHPNMEMQKVMEEGLAARRWIKDVSAEFSEQKDVC